MDLIEKLEKIKKHFEDINQELSDPEVLSDREKVIKLSKERSDLEDIIKSYKELSDIIKNIEGNKEIIAEGDDPDLIEMAESELEELETEKNKMEENIKLLLLPKDPNDDKDIIMEIRAGTGGDEAALFASDLMRMYLRYAENKGWKHEFITLNEIGVGGTKEAIIQITGEFVYGTLKFESGVHRVQRVPQTESSGRIHTSAATVAVLPEAEEVDIEINTSDLRIDTFRASGAGGQHVNKTESAIRITHLPTGMVVSCQDESSQHKNKEKALKVLRARLLQQKRERQASQRANMRKSLVSTGDRSAKIRTYNFPQGRVTDHRINLTLYRLEEIINGDLDEILEALETADMAAQLEDL